MARIINLTLAKFLLFVLSFQHGNEIIPMEAAVLRDLMHPNVIRLYDIYELEKMYVLVLETPKIVLSLFDIIEEKGRLEKHRIKNIFCQLVNVCLYLQKGSLWYRDLKVENILVNPADEKIKLIDFGGTVKTDRINVSKEFEGERLFIYFESNVDFEFL